MNDNSINFYILFYDFLFGPNLRHGFLDNCEFSYSEDGNKYKFLMKVETQEQDEDNQAWIRLKSKKVNERIQVINCDPSVRDSYWHDNEELTLTMRVVAKQLKGVHVTKRSTLGLKWHLPGNCKKIKVIRILGRWSVSGGQREKIDENYPLDILKSDLHIIKKAPSLNSEICTNVKVTGKEDTLVLTEVEPGEKIKIYNVSGVELKSPLQMTIL